MSVASRFECGSGENAYETVNPANPQEKVGRYAIMGSDELGTVIERANAARAGMGACTGWNARSA